MRTNILAALALLALSNSAGAALIQYSGTFSASGFSLNPASVSGSWSFVFDDSVVTGAAFEGFDGLALTSLTLTPSTVGTTAFSISNSSAYVFYVNGVLGGLAIGGGANAGFGPTPTFDDFGVNYSAGTLQVSGVQISNADPFPGDVQSASTSSGSFTVNSPVATPLPGTALLALAGLAGLGITRRVRARR